MQLTPEQVKEVFKGKTVKIQEYSTDFGVNGFNETIGVRITLITNEVNEITFYGFRGNSTKNNRACGATIKGRYFEGEDERNKALVKFVIAKEKRNSK